MKIFSQITAKILIFVFIILMSASFIPMDSMNHNNMNGADCFGVGCGMVQHIACDLSQNYFPEQCNLETNQDFFSNLIFSEYNYNQVVLSPFTPPPKFSLV